jgi:hypothetical protein
MGALRVAFERHEPSNSGMEFIEVLRCRQTVNIVENLDTFNFDLAQALIRRAHARIVNGCVVVTGAGGGIDRHRRQAVAKRVKWQPGLPIRLASVFRAARRRADSRPRLPIRRVAVARPAKNRLGCFEMFWRVATSTPVGVVADAAAATVSALAI